MSLRIEKSYYVNEPSAFMKRWEIVEYLHSWRPLKKDSSPWS
jgi:hypothetical protein